MTVDKAIDILDVLIGNQEKLKNKAAQKIEESVEGDSERSFNELMLKILETNLQNYLLLKNELETP